MAKKRICITLNFEVFRKFKVQCAKELTTVSNSIENLIKSSLEKEAE